MYLVSRSCSIPCRSQKCKYMENLETTCIIREMSWHVTVQTLFFFHRLLLSHLCKSVALLWCVYSNVVHQSIMRIWIHLLWSQPAHASHENHGLKKNSLSAHLKNCSSSPTTNPHRAPSSYRLGVTMETMVRVSQTRSFNPFSLFCLKARMDVLMVSSSVLTFRLYL